MAEEVSSTNRLSVSAEVAIWRVDATLCVSVDAEVLTASVRPSALPAISSMLVIISMTEEETSSAIWESPSMSDDTASTDLWMACMRPATCWVDSARPRLLSRFWFRTVRTDSVSPCMAWKAERTWRTMAERFVPMA